MPQCYVWSCHIWSTIPQTLHEHQHKYLFRLPDGVVNTSPVNSTLTS
jgi:hypothetical protein